MSIGVRENVCVVLVAIEDLDPGELGDFLERLANDNLQTHRCLVKVGSLDEAECLAAVLPPNVDVQILTNIALPAWAFPNATVFNMPPGSQSAGAEGLALALSDVVLISGRDATTELHRRAKELGKVLIKPQDKLTPLPPQEHIDDLMRLDPQVHRVWLYCVWGRLDALLAALLTFFPSIGRAFYAIATALFRKPKVDETTREKRLAAAGSMLLAPFLQLFDAILGWRDHSSYLGPRGWRDLCPDGRVGDRFVQPAMMAWFDRFERASGSGARCYRDLIWLAHLSAAAAVCSAVAGALWPGEELYWSILEILLLLGIVAIVWHGRNGLQRRWMACRLGAEELRASILCTSLFATPDLLLKTYRAHPGDQASRFAASTADAVAARAVRDHGLSNLPATFTAVRAATWVHTIAKDQLSYHQRNHTKLGRLEFAIELLNVTLFGGVIVVVVAHLLDYHSPWTLFVTAGAPAVAAALHGAATQLNIVHRSKSSEGCADDLSEVVKHLAPFLVENRQPAPDDWAVVREQAVRTANIMSKEVQDWHATLARQPLSLP